MPTFKSYCYDDNVIINRLTSALRSEQESTLKYLTNKSEEEYNTIKHDCKPDILWRLYKLRYFRYIITRATRKPREYFHSGKMTVIIKAKF